MKTLLLLVCIAFQIAPATAQVSQLKNSDVVELTKAGLSSETILAKIRQSGCKFQTEPSDLIALKKEGVDTDVIRAMIECESSKPSAEGLSVTHLPTKGSLIIQAAIVYKIGGAQPVARTSFVILDDDPVKILPMRESKVKNLRSHPG